MDEYLQAHPGKTAQDWAETYLASTDDAVLAAFEQLLADLNDASTLLQTLRAFKTCRESITNLITERARARAILWKE